MIELDEVEVREEIVDRNLKLIVDAVEQRDCYVRALQRTYPTVDMDEVRRVFDRKWDMAGILYGSCIEFAKSGVDVEMRGANGFAQMYRAKTLYAYANTDKVLR